MFGFLKGWFGGAPAPRMGYASAVACADPVRWHQVAGREAVLLGDIVSAGMVRYLYVLGHVRAGRRAVPVCGV